MPKGKPIEAEQIRTSRIDPGESQTIQDHFKWLLDTEQCFLLLRDSLFGLDKVERERKINDAAQHRKPGELRLGYINRPLMVHGTNFRSQS